MDPKQIYTDWANRYLLKAHPDSRPIDDLTSELRDFRQLARLIRAVAPADAAFDAAVREANNNLDGIQCCLNYIASIGVNVSKVTPTDIDAGQLGGTLQLLFALSTHKQEQRQRKKEERREGIMPPSTMASKLPSPGRSGIASPSPSRLLAPSRINFPKDKPGVSPSRAAGNANTTKLAQPASRIQPPKPSGNNNGSVTSSRCSSVASSATYTSIPSIPSKSIPRAPATAPAPAPAAAPAPAPATAPARTLPNPKALRVPVKAPVRTSSTLKEPVKREEKKDDSKMFKLFSKEKKTVKEDKAKPSPQPPRKELKAPASIASKPQPTGLQRPGTGLSKPASIRPPTRIAPPKVKTTPTLAAPSTVTLRKKDVLAEADKRTSKSSEEDSAYAGFGSASPVSSTNSSCSLNSKDSARGSMEREKKRPLLENTPSQDKPVLAVAPTQEVAPEPRAPAVGVVSPMLSQRKAAPSPVTPDEKKPPPVPSRCGSVLESDRSRSVSQEAEVAMQPPPMQPIRQPPTYQQLLNQGRIQQNRQSRLGAFVSSSSTSEDSLDSVSTAIHCRTSQSAGNTIEREQRREIGVAGPSNTGDSVAIYAKMQAKMRELRDNVHRGMDYHDSFEDSSSLSSGLSENFDDASTCSSEAMAAATAYGKIGDYGHFVRANGQKGTRSSSSTLEHRARRMAEQENIHQLLQQCRTRERGAACQGPPPARSHFSFGLSSDGDTLSVCSSRSASGQRTSIRHAPKRGETGGAPSGYHSLDRKYHMATYLDQSPHRLAVYDRPGQQGGMDRSAMAALLSPRRIPTHVDDRNIGGSLQRKESSHYGYGSLKEPVQLHRLTDEVQRSPSHSYRENTPSDTRGSQLSLASSTAYSTLAEKYESELRKMTRELESHRNTVSRLTRKEEQWTNLIDAFDSKLANISRHVEKAQLKPDEVSRLRQDIEHLRLMSHKVARDGERASQEGAGELLRQPSLESVASHRSSMSSSSKSSRTDKSSLSSFGGKSKKSWIRSSFSRAFTKSKNKKSGCSDGEASPMHQLHAITGSGNRLDEIEAAPAVVELKKQLQDKDSTLADVRLDALESAREVDILRETVNRLKNENKHLKQEMTRLAARSRASSHASLLVDDEPVYEVPPSERSSGSSKRSSGCNAVKVTVNVDLTGTVREDICPDNEIILGFLPLPNRGDHWSELDSDIARLFDEYINRVDPDRQLGLSCTTSLVGYQMGGVVRRIGEGEPDRQPSDVLTTGTTIRIFLKGAAQQCVDSLVLECLFPQAMLNQLLKHLLTHRRLVLSGALGIGKSNLARQLSAYLSLRVGLPQDGVVDVKVPDDSEDKAMLKVEQQLTSLLRADQPVVVLIDNIPRQRISFVSSVFASVEVNPQSGPYVICTVNRACQLPEMQVHHNFKLFQLTNRMEGVRGFMARFLRRRIVEHEFRAQQTTPQELQRVIAFLPLVLHAVNQFIEKANSIDVTIGPRTFLQCPFEVEESRVWFIRLWNEKLVPYMAKAAREGVKMLGRCGQMDDPTEAVCEAWPWLEGPAPEQCLHRPQLAANNDAKQPFNPLDTLIRLQASRNPVANE